MMQKILISTGGTGGHVVPATIFYEHLKDQFHVTISTDNRGIKFLDKKKYNIEIFNVTPISKNIFLLPFQFFLTFFLIIKSIFFLILTILMGASLCLIPILEIASTNSFADPSKIGTS